MSSTATTDTTQFANIIGEGSVHIKLIMLAPSHQF